MKTLKKLRTTLIIMYYMGSVENSGIPKRLKAKYDKPDSFPPLVNYWKEYLTICRAHSLFSALTTMLNDCDTSVSALDTAEQATLGGGSGKATARDSQYRLTDIQMEKPLRVIQDAMDNMSDLDAKALLEHFLLTVDGRSGHGPTVDGATPGDTAGTILVTDAYVDSTTSYLRMISEDKQTWYVGDFGKKTRGIISKINENPLVSRKLYYVKVQKDGSDGKSDFGPIREVYAK